MTDLRCYVLVQHQDWFDVNCATAAQGFAARGWKVFPITREDAYPHPLGLNPDTVVVGSVPVVRRALQEARFQLPGVLDYPEFVRRHLRRSLLESTLGAVRDLFGGHAPSPVFIKPRGAVKAFTGHVVHSEADLIHTYSLSDRTPVWTQEVVQFKAEWRAFVLNRQVVHVAYYSGVSPLIFPCTQIFTEVIEQWGAAPAAYSIDVGVVDPPTADCRAYTALIELNDGYALGAYGMEPTLYSQFLEARWREMTQDNRRCISPLNR